MQGIIIDTCNDLETTTLTFNSKKVFEILILLVFANLFEDQCLICKMDIFVNY